MAFVLPFVGYAVATFISSRQKKKGKHILGAAVGSYLGINAAALCAAIEFGIQPMLFRDTAGKAMYCPYGLNISLPAMLIGHLTLFGLAEVVFTVGVLLFVQKTSPNLRTDQHRSETTQTPLPLRILLGALVVLTPLGLLAEGTAWGEWGENEIAAAGAGFTPSGMTSGLHYGALLPDYSVAGLPEWFGYMLSAVIGVAALIIIFKLISSAHRSPVAES